VEQKMTDAYHLGSRFVTMFSYERSVVYSEGTATSFSRSAAFVR
jgi:hypothetical protein